MLVEYRKLLIKQSTNDSAMVDNEIKGYIKNWIKNWWKVILGIIVLIILIIWVGYRLAWTGFGGYTSPAVQTNQTFQREKTLWDWMELLIVPAILAGGAYLLNKSVSQREQAATEQRTQETALQTYLDKMTELLLDEKLCESEVESKVRDVARARTLTVLRGLDGDRKGALIRFLYEADLIDKNNRVIDLSGADLSGADLNGANLSEAKLSGADLSEAKLSGADLSEANPGVEAMRGINLIKADLNGAKLSGANLRWADLSEANLSEADLNEADLVLAKLSEVKLISADLSGADLMDANLRWADLSGANLSEAKLISADLGGANLSEAKLSGSILGGAKYTKNAIGIRDTMWPEGIDPDDKGAILIKE